MIFRQLFDPQSSMYTYLLADEATRQAVVIDPVFEHVRRDAALIDELCLKLKWTLETHVHADHLTGSRILKEKLGAGVAIGARITEVQRTFVALFNLSDVPTDGSQFDRLVKDGDEIPAGSLPLRAIATPGHTPACTSFLVGDALFTGDAMFMPDFGTGRCDFPAGSARDLYHSIHEKLYALPDSTRVFVGHDYQPGGRDLAWETSIGESKARNKQLRAETTEAEFVKFRTERDAGLSAPKLLLPSIQVNLRAGNLPPAEDNGRRYLKLPLFGPPAE